MPPADRTKEVASACATVVRRHRHQLAEPNGRPVSQERLGQLAGLHRTHIGMIERGERSVKLVTIVQLADAFGVRPSQLVAEIEAEL